MSNWTHVAGIIRVNSLRQTGDTEQQAKERMLKIFGKSFGFEDVDAFDDAEINPNDYLPFGSEGSLDIDIWINPEISSIAAYTISIFGDLRDYDNPDEIVSWFKRKCNQLSVRQAAIVVNNEQNGVRHFYY